MRARLGVLEDVPRAADAIALYQDAGATLDDLREAVTTLEEIETTARRVLGGAKPLTVAIERELQQSREVLQIAQRRQNV